MTLRFQTPEASYDISIGCGLLNEAGRIFDLKRKVLVVTDEGVPEAYPKAVLEQCADGRLLVLPQGEGAKDLKHFEAILAALLEGGFTRRDAVVAVGGGVVGDISGFAAACYQRGIDFYNIPTTLLSEVDSSVGGKTAVNFHGVKNIVGAFHHPSGVLIDPLVNSTLSPRLVSEGLAEVVKMAATSDAALFRLLEETDNLMPIMPEIIAAALRIKIAVVEKDPEEKGLRAVLNFGHTIGHAIEAASAGEFFHGEAVAAGMLYTAGGEAAPRIEALLRKFRLPVSDPYTTEELMRYAIRDKKRGSDGVKLVRVDNIGSFRFEWADEAALESLIQSRK